MSENITPDITEIVSKEIINRSIDITTDYSEMILDSVLDSDVLKEIPVVKSIIAFYDIRKSIINRHNVKKDTFLF